MTCLTKAATKDVEDLGRAIAGGKRTDYEKHKEQYDKIAYFLLSANNGYPLWYTPSGEQSPLWQQLKELHKDDTKSIGYDLQAVILDKAYFYTPEYAQKHGAWLEEYDSSGKPLPEPTLSGSISAQDQQILFQSFQQGRSDLMSYMDLLTMHHVFSDRASVRVGLKKDVDQYVADNYDQGVVDDMYNEWLNESEYAKTAPQDALDQAKIRFELQHKNNLRVQALRNQTEHIVKHASVKLASLWRIKIDEQGNVDMSLYSKDKDEIKWLQAMFVNSLKDKIYDRRAYNALLTIIKKHLIDADVHTYIPSLVGDYIDMVKDSDTVLNFIKADNPKLNINDKKEVEAAIDALKTNIQRLGEDYSKKPSKAKLSLLWIWDKIQDLIQHGMFATTVRGAAILGSVSAVAGSIAFSPAMAGALIVGTAGTALGATIGAINNKVLQYNIKSDGTGHISHWEQRKIIYSIYSDIVAQAAIFQDLDACENTGFVNATQWSSGTTLDRSLNEIRTNLIIRIKSLNAVANKSLYSNADESRLRLMLSQVEKAIASDFVSKDFESTKAYTEFVNLCQKQLAEAQHYIETHDASNVDIRQLMYYKTDVIAAYDKLISSTFSVERMNSLPLDALKRGGDVYRLMTESIKLDINKIKHDFTNLVDSYLDKVVDDYIMDTAGKVLPTEQAARFKANVLMWLRDQHVSDTLGCLDKFVIAAKANKSPVIRMIHNMISEMDASVQRESLAAAADMEYLRTEERSIIDRVSVYNTLNKYAERDKNGKFTGNFVAPVNQGAAEAEFKEFRENLQKEMKLKKDQFGDLIFESDDDWKEYNIQLLMFQGNIKRNEDGTYTQVGRQRFHRRFKMQYYIDRLECLSRAAFMRLSQLNEQIHIIERQCLREFTYVDKNGVTQKRNVPIISELPPNLQQSYQELQLQKSTLDSSYKFWVKDGIITDLELKNEEELKIADQFAKWNEKKASYYSDTEEADYSLYNAIIKDYDDRIAATTDVNERGDLISKRDSFNKYSTSTQINPKLKELLQYREELIEYQGPEDVVKQYERLIRTRKSIIKFIRTNNEKRSRNLDLIGEQAWKSIKAIDIKIKKLENKVKPKYEKTKSHEAYAVYSSKDLYKQQSVKKLNPDGSESSISWLDWNEANTPGFVKSNYQRKNDAGYVRELSLLRETVPTVQALNILGSDVYTTEPTGMFAERTSSMRDDDYDESITDWLQADKKMYDNSKEYNKIKDDKFYQKMLEMMETARSNYSGLNLGYKYKLPQREASNLWLRRNPISSFKTEWNQFFNFTTLDVDVNDNIYFSPDGTIVETVPSRWINRISDSNNIDTDLVSSVSDFLTESIKYKYRQKLSPLMEAFKFELQGGFNESSNAQFRVAASEIDRGIYGRTITGSGPGGRLTSGEQLYAKLSKNARSVLHKRLMGHNWLSVLKNGYDSFCNMIQQIFMGKYFKSRSILNAIEKMGSNIFPAMISWNRSRAMNMTQALMQMNGVSGNVHEKYKNQNQWWFRRALSKIGSLEFEGVDYSYKALITETVYDTFRLVYNPVTDSYEYMNPEECELAYLATGGSRLDGYNAWSASKDTLRKAYKFNKKTGIAELRDKIETVDKNGNPMIVNVLDKIAPVKEGTIDGRSRILETKIRNTIVQLSSTVNGMLQEEDKAQIAKDYRGALLVSFRGWMITQAGENFKHGYDFSYEQDYDNTNTIKAQLNRDSMTKVDLEAWEKARTNASTPDFMGIYNFGTGTIDDGLHVGLWKTIRNNLGLLIACMGGINVWNPKFKYKMTDRSRKLTEQQWTQLNNFAAALDTLGMTLALTMLAYNWYSGDDDYGKNDSNIWHKSLIYTAMLASISERLPQIGSIGFYTNSLDLLNSVTVATTLGSDAKYLFSTVTDLLSGEGKNKLKSGTFTDKTKLQRDLTYDIALFSGLFGIDDLPIELLLDFANQHDFLPENAEGITFRDYNLNYMKGTTEIANKQRFKWYEGIEPTPIFVRAADALGHPIYPKSENKNNERYTGISIKLPSIGGVKVNGIR